MSEDEDLSTDEDTSSIGECVFSHFLRMEYESRAHVSVVKAKRDTALLKLSTAELALERKDYTAASMFLFEIYKTIDEDEYHDEYQCEPSDFNMLLFSACVTCALAKYYVRAEELLLKLQAQTPNPVIYYISAVVYFYQLKFTEAQACLERIVNSFSSLSTSDITWPWTDVKITNLSAEEFKGRVLVFLYMVDAIKDLKNESKAIALDEKKYMDKFNWSSNRYKEVKLNGKKTHVGTFLRQDVYVLIRNSLDSLFSIRLGNLPSEYKDNMIAIHKKVGDYFGLHTKEETAVKKMKHKLVQTGVKVQNAQTQSHAFKQVHRSTQIQGSCVENEDLELSLKQTAAKLKSAESNIINLKAKKLELEQQLSKEEEYYKQQNEKWLIKEQHNEFNLTKLQTLIEVLEEKGVEKDFILMQCNQKISDCTDLLTKTYKSTFSMQQTYYDHLIAKCQNTIEMLAKLTKDMVANPLITREEVFSSMTEWEAALEQSIKAQDTLNVYIRNVNTGIEEHRFPELYDMDCAIESPKEPPSLASQYFPTLVLSSGEYQNKMNFDSPATPKRETEERCVQTTWCFGDLTEDTSVNRFEASQLNQVQQASRETAINPLYSATSIKSDSNISTVMNSIFNSDSSGSLRSNIRKHTRPSSLSERGEPNKAVESENASLNVRKLLMYIKSKLPSHDEHDLLRALNKFREQNNGKLTGLTIHFILYNVRKILGVPEPSWEEVKPQWSWQGDNGETSCTICFASLEEFPATVLKCKHKFHVECIRKWLAENSICAICRVYVTMDEDFPPLKH